MRTNLLVIAALAVSLVGCDRIDQPKTVKDVDQTRTTVNTTEIKDANDTGRTVKGVTRTTVHTTEVKDVDNTGRNVRDRDMNTVTPGDQSESAADRTMTQDIRKAIMDDAALSVNAKNVKVMTRNGVVVLRGVVDSAREKEVIAQKVSSVKGVTKVDNQLEVKQVVK